MKKISLFLAILIILSATILFTACNDEPELLAPPTINGTPLADFTIVYDESALDYNKRAAEFIAVKAEELYGVKLSIVDDETPAAANEIVVGETNRPISASLDAETEGVEFSISQTAAASLLRAIIS